MQKIYNQLFEKKSFRTAFWFYGVSFTSVSTFVCLAILILEKTISNYFVEFLYLIGFLFYFFIPVVILYSSIQTFRTFENIYFGLIFFIFNNFLLIAIWILPLLIIFGFSFLGWVYSALEVNP
tara:strand:- start:93 stop:461 length:369 start_codon:yes stop_codon:yes gene_type:complete